MSRPTVFLSAASVDLREWREVLHTAFERAGFSALTQDKSLRAAPGNVKRLLVETIAGADCIIHLAGMGYGSDATDPFPEAPDFQYSWTQFEYYHGHQQKKDVIAFVCAPALSKAGFAEAGKNSADIARKHRLQLEHRQRVMTGTFENTPLPNHRADRTCNEQPVKSVGDLLTAVAAIVGTLHVKDRDACARAEQELRDVAAIVARIEAGVGSANDKLDRILAMLRPVANPPFQLPPPASEYFGRAAMVADLAARLRKHQRTDVWGGPGMGKTALAAQALGQILGARSDVSALATSPFPDGIVFLDLYLHKGSLEAAWNALANAFDDSLPTDMPASDRARKACAKRQALVILEGAEELGTQLNAFIAVLAAESALLVLTREETQTAASRRLKLNDLLSQDEALALLRHLAGPEVPQNLLAAVQSLLGGHPLALTWAGSQLNDGTQPAKRFLSELEAQPFKKLSEPGGKSEHTLQWMFDRSVRLMAETTRTVLAAAARVSEPFGADLAQVAGGQESDLQRLVQLSFLRVAGEGWQFAHALAGQYARALPLPEGLLAKLGTWAIEGIASADARCRDEGTAPLGPALAHATALLVHDGTERQLTALAEGLLYHDRNSDPVGIRRGRLDLARTAVEAVRQWQDRASAEEKARPAWQRKRFSLLTKLGNVAVAQGDLAGALRSFTQSKTIAERLVASDPANAGWQRDLYVSLIKLGELAVAQGDLAGALRSFAESKTIAERLAASDPANAGWQRDLYVSHIKLGELAVAQGDLAGALRSFAESKTIAERLAASDPANAAWQRDLYVSLIKLGELAVAQGDLAGALRSFTEGKTIAERLAASDPANAAWQRDLSVSLNRLGDLAVAQGDLAGALRSFTEGKTIAERLAASDPANAGWQRDLSVSLNKLGELAVAQGDLAGALRSFTEDKAIAERLAASDPANAEWQRDLYVSLIKLGEFAVAQGDLAGALRSFTESKTIAERLASSDPANAGWQRDLSVSLNKLGELAVAQGDLAGALRSFSESKTIAERLAASDPANAAWQRDLSLSLDRLGDLGVAQGDLEGALRSFTESMTIRERLVASDPANAEWQRDLSYVCWVIAAKVFQPQQRWAEALELMEQSLRIDERLAATDPTNVMWQNDVRVSRSLVDELRSKVG